MSTIMRKIILNKRGRPYLHKRKWGRLPLQKKEIGNPSYSPSNIVGCRITHDWKDGNGLVTRWNAIVLDQLPTNPPLYFLKYDGVDCVYGVELHSDERVLKLEILPKKMFLPKVRDNYFASIIVGRAVEHTFEGRDGSKHEWRGMVLAQVPIMESWFYISYENDPVLYVYQLLDDYIDGNLRILPGYPPAKMKLEASRSFFTWDCVPSDYITVKKKRFKVILQILLKPSVYFFKFENETLIYVYQF